MNVIYIVPVTHNGPPKWTEIYTRQTPPVTGDCLFFRKKRKAEDCTGVAYYRVTYENYTVTEIERFPEREIGTSDYFLIWHGDGTYSPIKAGHNTGFLPHGGERG